MNRREITLGDRTFELHTSTLRGSDGVEIFLRTQSLRVLAMLADAEGQLVKRENLIETIWSGVSVTDDSLVQCIRDIRVALNDKDRRILRTVVGRGYSLNIDQPKTSSDGVPTLVIEPFALLENSTVAEELQSELQDVLISRFAIRSGLKVLTNAERGDNVDYQVSGKIQVRGDQLKVFFWLSQSRERSVFFSDVKEALASSASELPAILADAISAQLRVHMIVNDGASLSQCDDNGLTVQELKAKAAWHMARFQRENLVAASAALETVCEIQADDPVALAMSASMATQLIPLIPFAEVQPLAQSAIDKSNRAVELDPSIDYVLRTRGNIRLWLQKDHDGARRDCERALKLNPAFHLAHFTIAESDIFSGELDAGIARLGEMMQRAPLDPQNPLYFSMIAIAELLAGRFEKALAASREAYDLWPSQPWMALTFAISVVAAGRPEDAPEYSRYQSLPQDHFRVMPFVEDSQIKQLEDLYAKAAQSSGCA